MESIPPSAGMSPPSPSEDPPSSTEQLTKKREQVKNACVNCQKACKKCDSGRPCQRCIKYNLATTCVDSVRKQRRKGIKRGPYKKRKKDPAVTTDHESSTPQSAGPSSQPAQSGRTMKSKRLSRSLSAYRRQTTPRVLGPGSIPILRNDDDGSSSTDESESLQSSQIASFDAMSLSPPLIVGGAAGHQQIFIPANPSTQSSRHDPLPHGQTHPPYYQFQQTREPIRLPPIASFDQAQPVIQPPTTSSLHILTHVALGSAPAHHPPTYPPPLPGLTNPPVHPATQLSRPTTRPIPPQYPPPSQPPPPDRHDTHSPRRFTQMKSTPPSPSSHDAETHIHRLSQQLGNIHIGQQSHTEWMEATDRTNQRDVTGIMPLVDADKRSEDADATQTNDF